MDWHWYWVRDWLGIGYIYWDSYWFGNGMGNLDLLDLRLGVLDNGTGMVGSINKVGDVLLYLDFLGLNCDFWWMGTDTCCLVIGTLTSLGGRATAYCCGAG